jgi:hypothetical protein
LIELGFEFVCEFDHIKTFRKRKWDKIIFGSVVVPRVRFERQFTSKIYKILARRKMLVCVWGVKFNI